MLSAKENLSVYTGSAALAIRRSTWTAWLPLSVARRTVLPPWRRRSTATELAPVPPVWSTTRS